MRTTAGVTTLPLSGTVSVADGGHMAKFELYKSPNAEYRWRLKADNGNVTATSGEGYSSKAAAQAGIVSVKRSTAGASVLEV
jgi:uncharacterized protein YegP (UPF0339 family)